MTHVEDDRQDLFYVSNIEDFHQIVYDAKKYHQPLTANHGMMGHSRSTIKQVREATLYNMSHQLECHKKSIRQCHTNVMKTITTSRQSD